MKKAALTESCFPFCFILYSIFLRYHNNNLDNSFGLVPSYDSNLTWNFITRLKFQQSTFIEDF